MKVNEYNNPLGVHGWLKHRSNHKVILGFKLSNQTHITIYFIYSISLKLPNAIEFALISSLCRWYERNCP